MRIILLIASILLIGYAQPAIETTSVCDDDVCAKAEQDPQPNTPNTPNPAQYTQSSPIQPKKKHAWYLGASIFSGDGVLFEKDSASNFTKRFHAKDGGVIGLVGGLYRIAPRHTLRYGVHFGFSSIAFSNNYDSSLFELSGAKGGVGLGYEWSFYLKEHFAWSAVFGTEYTAYYYKKESNLLLLQEIMPRIGIGFEGRGHHYFEVFFGIPVYANLEVKNTHSTFVTSRYPRHLRLGFSYMYRF